MHVIMSNLKIFLDRKVNPNAPSKKEFAKEIGCTQRHLYNLLSGKNMPRLDLVDKIEKSTNGYVSASSLYKNFRYNRVN